MKVFWEFVMQSQARQPVFILVRPQMGENIGGAARAMWNFGLDRMRVVKPRDGWPNDRAVAMASGAGRLLDEALLCDKTQVALEDCHFVFATTARARGLTKPVFTPERAMFLAREKIAAGDKVAVLFGPERSGLENDDIARANAIINVPVNPEYGSINLAQCVLLTAYEWRRTQAEIEEGRLNATETEWASHAEMDALQYHYEDRLDQAGFFFPPEKAGVMKINLRNMWSRMQLTRADVQILHGVMRQMVRWKNQSD